MSNKKGINCKLTYHDKNKGMPSLYHIQDNKLETKITGEKYKQVLKIFSRSNKALINGNDMIIYFENSSLYICDYMNLLNLPTLEGLSQCVQNIKNIEYLNKEALKNKDLKKGKRLNPIIKYVGILVVLSTSTSFLNDVDANKKQEVPLEPVLEDTEIEIPKLNEEIEIVESNNEVVAVIDNDIDADQVEEEIEVFSVENYYNSGLEKRDLIDDIGSGINSEKYDNTAENYGELITKYSKLYGLDEKLINAIATQEKGVHDRTIDKGGAVGLMQIQYNVWINQTINAYKYNEVTDEFELTEKRIDDSTIRSVEGNIEIACMIFQCNLEQANYNIEVAIHMYNHGSTKVMNMIKDYSNKTGMSKKQILDTNDRGWLQNGFGNGDENYLENVLKWTSYNEFYVINPISGEMLVYNANTKKMQ